jgi:hypothetical protein
MRRLGPLRLWRRRSCPRTRLRRLAWTPSISPPSNTSSACSHLHRHHRACTGGASRWTARPRSRVTTSAALASGSAVRPRTCGREVLGKGPRSRGAGSGRGGCGGGGLGRGGCGGAGVGRGGCGGAGVAGGENR